MHGGIGSIDSGGWTQLAPNSDSLTVYVSSSEGDDANDGLTPETALNSIDAANSLVRDGYPDWILLKRGDTFLQPTLGAWKNGRSAAEPLVLSYYGSSGKRPVVKLTTTFIDWNGGGRSNIALVGIDFYRAISDPDSPEFTNESCESALRLLSLESQVGNILIEDCRFRYCWLIVQGGSSSFIDNFNLRRNIIANAWTHNSTYSHDGRIQGIYITNASDILMEENVFHHCGWSEVIPDANANQYNHNVYMSTANDGPILLRGNVFSFGSAQGVQLRSGGTAELNAFIGNSVGMNLGYTEYPVYNTEDTFARDNVFTDGRQQVPYLSSEPQSGAVWGLWKQLINNVHVDDNIVANDAVTITEGTFIRAYSSMGANEFGTGNIGWNWGSISEPASDPGWLDPTRNAESFAQSLGLLDYQEWIERAMNRELGAMPYDLTAYKYVGYIREGFNKTDISAPFAYTEGLGNDIGIVPASGSYVIPPTATLPKNSEKQFAALTYPSNTDFETFTWSSDAPLVATVDGDGLVSALGAGTATISATSSTSNHTGESIVTVVDLGKNLALNKPVTFSSVSGTSDMLVDGSVADADRWSAQFYPQTAMIDLGANFDLNSVRLYPYLGRDYQYKISVAPDGSDVFQTVVDRSANTETGSVLIDTASVSGRWVLLEVTGSATYTGSFISINELEVFGTGGPPPVAVTGIELSTSSQVLFPGDSFKLNATVSPEDAGDKTVSWLSNNPSVASVKADGSVSANGLGTAVITATTIDGHFVAAATIEVRDFGANVALDRPVLTSSMVDDGPSDRLVDGLPTDESRWSALGFPQWAEIDLGANYDISAFRLFPYQERDYQYRIAVAPSGSDAFQIVVNRSSNTESSSVFTDTVDVKGRRIMLLVAGAASYSGSYASINELEVYGSISEGGAAVTGVSILPASLQLVSGASEQLEALVAPADANNALVDWSTSDPSVVSVAQSGIVTAHSVGNATVTVTTRDGGFTGEASIEVVPPPFRAGSESFDNFSASLTDRFSDGSYIGDNGEEWFFSDGLRIEPPQGIEGITAQVRRFSGSVSTILPDGLNTLRFTVQTQPGQAPDSAKLEVFVDGVSQGTFKPEASDVPKPFVLRNIGIRGDVEIRFAGLGYFETFIDSISWNEQSDLNGDGSIDQADMDLIRSAMYKESGDEGFLEEADLDGDGVITRADYNAWYRLARQGL